MENSDLISLTAEGTPSGKWMNYDGRCGAESKHISFKISHFLTTIDQFPVMSQSVQGGLCVPLVS